MNKVYRIIVSPYGYDHWNIFTTDKAMFELVSKQGNTDKARAALGTEVWEEFIEGPYIKPPYVILGEGYLHQRD